MKEEEEAMDFDRHGFFGEAESPAPSPPRVRGLGEDPFACTYRRDASTPSISRHDLGPRAGEPPPAPRKQRGTCSRLPLHDSSNEGGTDDPAESLLKVSKVKQLEKCFETFLTLDSNLEDHQKQDVMGSTSLRKRLYEESGEGAMDVEKRRRSGPR